MAETVEIFRLEIEDIRRDLEALRGEFKRTTGETEKAAQSVEKSYDDVVGSIAKAEKESRDLTKTILEQEKITAEWKRELAGVENELTKINTTARKNQLLKEQQRLKNVIRENVSDIRELKVSKKQADESVRNLKRMEKGFEDNRKQTDFLNDGIKRVGATLLASLAVDRIISFGKEVNRLAAEMQQADRKAAIVFGDSLDRVTEAAENNAIAIGLTRREYIDAAAGIQDILVPLGFARERASILATQTTDLAGAISVWSAGQYDAAESAQILQKALTGEVEQLKSVGIVIDQSSKQFNERIKQLMQTEGLTLQQAKALDILNQITEKSVDAQTNLGDSQEDIAVKQARVNARFREARDELIERVTPAIIGMTDAAADAVEAVGDFGDRIDQAVRFFQDFYDESIVFRTVVVSLTRAIVLNFQLMFKAIELTIAEPIRAAVTAIKAARKILNGDFDGALQDANDFGKRFINDQKDFVKDIVADFQQGYDDIANGANSYAEERQKALDAQKKQEKEAEETAAKERVTLASMSNAALLSLAEKGNENAKRILSERMQIWNAELEAYRMYQNQIQQITEDVQAEIRSGEGIFDLANPDGEILDISDPIENIEEATLGMHERLGISWAEYAHTVSEIQQQLLAQGVNANDAYEMAVKETERRIIGYRIAAAQSAVVAFGTVFNTLFALLGENAKNSQELALFKIALNTAQGVSGAVAAAAQSSTDTYSLIANIAAGIAAVLAGIAEAKQALEPVPSFTNTVGRFQGFAEGTEYVEAVNSKQGRKKDDIPAMLTKGEGVVTASANASHPGVVKALNEGTFERWVSGYIIDNRNEFDRTMSVTNNFNDRNMVRQLKRNNEIGIMTVIELQKLGMSKRYKRKG